jgi:signal peptidase II
VPSVVADRSRRRRRQRLIVAIVVTIVAVDQATKVWAVTALSDHPRSIVGDDVQLRLSYNSGGAFSLLRGRTPILAVIAIVMAVVLVRTLRRSDDQRLLLALALGLGGLVGNLVDRLGRSPGFLRGEVVDFVKVGSWPTFNVADSAITIGAVALVAALVFGSPTRSESGGDAP